MPAAIGPFLESFQAKSVVDPEDVKIDRGQILDGFNH
jgi:hypothetical protein